MNIKIHKAKNEEHRMAARVVVNGKEMMNFVDGEHEDNSLGRNFRDIFQIPELLKAHHEAIICGQSITIQEKNMTWDEWWEWEETKLPVMHIKQGHAVLDNRQSLLAKTDV